MSRVLAGVSGIRRGVALSAGLVMAGGLAVFATGAGAAPQPTVSQVQAKINQLTTQFDKVSEQLDQASQQLSAAQTKLGQVQVRLKNANAQFQTAQANMAATAAAAFEDTGATSIAGVLTSGDPSVLLQQGSLLMELSGNRSAQTKQLLTDASQLAGVEQEMSRTETGIAGLKRQLSDHKSSLGKLIDTQKATLASLTVPQQQTVQTNSIGAGGTGTTSATYTGTTSTQGGKAVAFAYAQLGKPYQWGATGPGSYRLLRAGPGRLGGGRREHPAHHLRAVGRPPAHLHLRARARRPAVLRRSGARGHLRGRRRHHRRPADREGCAEDPPGWLVPVHLGRRGPPVDSGAAGGAHTGLAPADPVRAGW